MDTNVWKIGHAVFNALTHDVWSRTRKTHLGENDAKLLVLLIAAYGKPPPNKATLRTEIWGSGSEEDNLYKSIQLIRDAFGGSRDEYIVKKPYRLVKKPFPTSWPEDETSFLALISTDKESRALAESPDQRIEFANDERRRSHDAQKEGGFRLSVDGIILNSVGELVFRKAGEQIIPECKESYQRCLEDFAFALVYGTHIKSKWPAPATGLANQSKRPQSPAEALIAILPPGLYGADSFDDDLRDGALLKHPEELQMIRRYLVCAAECMREAGFLSVCRDLLKREADMFLMDHPSLFKEGGGPDDYHFGKEYYKHNILNDIPSIFGDSAIARLVHFLPKGPDPNRPDKYAQSALVQFVIQVMLMHLTTMYEFEKNSERHDLRRVPYALRAAVTQQFEKTHHQRQLRYIVVRHALWFALTDASGVDRRESIVGTLSHVRGKGPFKEIRDMLADYNLLILHPDPSSEQRANKLLDDFYKITFGTPGQADDLRLAHASVLRELRKIDSREYDKHLYDVFPELSPSAVHVTN